ncbi:hypothetical protein Q8791_02085 [Nocardiopsis sp. CT-R113]|uniref:DUF4352 domain-containing protein n=1 Tax=Nocardiopsis codii TaxID=3065942 RepID=A0ABU7K1H8_9ACTN|nr:DUF4352 domain-containing protein [Nocardiopsis sp. CT-R113]MEE2036010.1 hypothetical protein [Nocardiopsis sp. CT-R113]
MSYPQYPSGPQQPPYGQPPQGPPPGGQPPYGPTGGQPPYGPTGGQPPYGGPPGGQPPYDMPPGGQPPYGPPPKKGMSTGAKVGIGVGGCLGLVIIAIVVIVIIASLSGSGGDTPAQPETSSASEAETSDDTESSPAEEPVTDESGITATATQTGTAGDVLDDTTYTVVDVEITNNSSEAVDVNPIYFTFVLDDGTERDDWAETIFADITPMEAVSVEPGDSVSGQLATVGEVTVAELRFDPSFGMREPIVIPVG